MAYTLAWRLRGRLRRATVCVKVGYARLRGTHLPTRNASAKIAQGPFSFSTEQLKLTKKNLKNRYLTTRVGHEGFESGVSFW